MARRTTARPSPSPLRNPSGAVLADAEATGTIRSTETEAAPLTAAFLDLPPAGHGGSAFTLQLRFSEEFSLSYKTLQNHALGVSNGTLTGVSRVTQGEDRAWNVTVTPAGGGAVTVALAETTDCAAEGAICTADERMLAAVSATVPETAQAPPPTPFRVSAGLPAEHGGASEITFEVSFNKEPQADYSYTTLRGKTLRIRQGGASLTPKVRRLNAPHNDRWEVKVTPGSKEDLTVSDRAVHDAARTRARCARRRTRCSRTGSTGRSRARRASRLRMRGCTRGRA